VNAVRVENNLIEQARDTRLSKKWTLLHGRDSKALNCTSMPSSTKRRLEEVQTAEDSSDAVVSDHEHVSTQPLSFLFCNCAVKWRLDSKETWYRSVINQLIFHMKASEKKKSGRRDQCCK
jgi:hypothetical protein